MLEHEYKLSLL